MHSAFLLFGAAVVEMLVNRYPRVLYFVGLLLTPLLGVLEIFLLPDNKPTPFGVGPMIILSFAFCLLGSLAYSGSCLRKSLLIFCAVVAIPVEVILLGVLALNLSGLTGIQ